jgi:murein DD-endopeptidase MepM/ murein hydrolase activator NlpD
MQFLTIVPAFFLVGFLAGSLDAASGLGQLEQTRIVQKRNVDASIIRSSAGATFHFDLAPDLREQALTLPPEVADAVRAAIEASPPQELVDPLARNDEVKSPAVIRSSLFLPEEPDWWTNRHEGGPRRLVTFGPRRPVSLPDALSMTWTPERTFVSLPPAAKQSELLIARRDNNRTDSARDVVRQEFIMPFEHGRVTSMFNQGRYHPAIDLAGRLGSSVHATTRRQRVTFTGWRRGYGNTVMTRDDSGRTHLYAHLQRTIARVGSVLDQGQVLGLLGSTGRSTGPHVHYEIRTAAGRHINPVTLLFPGRRVGRGFAWNGSRSVMRVAANAQPLPR